MTYSERTVQDIFYTGSHAFRVDRQLVVNVCFLLNEHLLFVTKIDAASYRKYHGYIDDVRSGRVSSFDIEGGQIEHMALKLVGRDMLKKDGFQDVAFEQEFHGFRPDVMTLDGTIVIECGNTNPNKIFEYFKYPDAHQMVVVPYPESANECLSAFVFTPSDDLRDFLLFREKEEAEKLKKLRK